MPFFCVSTKQWVPHRVFLFGLGFPGLASLDSNTGEKAGLEGEKPEKKKKTKTEAREHPTDLGRIRQRMKINFHPTIPLSFRHVCRVSTRKGDGSKATRIQKPSLQCPRVPATGHVYGITLCAVRVHRQQAMSTCNRPCVPSKGHRPKLVLQKQ